MLEKHKVKIFSHVLLHEPSFLLLFEGESHPDRVRSTLATALKWKVPFSWKSRFAAKRSRQPSPRKMFSAKLKTIRSWKHSRLWNPCLRNVNPLSRKSAAQKTSDEGIYLYWESFWLLRILKLAGAPPQNSKRVEQRGNCKNVGR